MKTHSTTNTSITLIVLTFNEEKQIQRCIHSAKENCEEIFIIDSFSTDNTKSIAENLGAKVVQKEWLAAALL